MQASPLVTTHNTPLTMAQLLPSTVTTLTFKYKMSMFKQQSMDHIMIMCEASRSLISAMAVQWSEKVLLHSVR